MSSPDLYLSNYFDIVIPILPIFLDSLGVSPHLVLCFITIDLIPVKQLWDNGSAIIRCYIAHRFKEDIDSLQSDNCLSLLLESINHNTWGVAFLQPDTGLFCISPTHSFQDGGNRPFTGWTDPKEPALSPLPVASYNDTYILSHYLKWARGDISPELAFQKDISFGSFSHPFYDHNPKQPVSLAVITTTAPAPTIIGKLKNLQYRNPQDMFKTTDNEMEVTIQIEEWWVGGEFVGQKNEPPSETVLKGWTRVSYDQLWSHSSGRCPYLDHRWLVTECSRLVHIDWNGQDWLSAGWLSQAQYFCDTVNGLCKDIPESAASLLEHLELTVIEALGLPELIPKAELQPHKFVDYQYEATKQFQLFRGYNPSTQEFVKRHGLPLVDIIWPDGKTEPDEDGDSWYDCPETQDKNSDDLHEDPFPVSKEFIKRSLDNQCSTRCNDSVRRDKRSCSDENFDAQEVEGAGMTPAPLWGSVRRALSLFPGFFNHFVVVR
ncbi:hypothetical protein K435DRAFT_904108 [Dendrothele bispora CBS 962.96]|uniref:Uncharacterized protein n=1 Tax=Dendrothele bispora (strain CBS 962.96) TaxID=1314807 RepID=A0A4S8LUJ0_DENBC|nr:hypothetical protein K435DRAFT_904108 [Dendrothele bispora CBS 962.96]